METGELAKKIGNLFVIGFPGKEITDEVKELIHDYHVGAIILFGRNIGTPKEVLALTTSLQKEAKLAGYTYPLLICVDQENGVVRRLGEDATIFPGAMALGATDDPDNAYEIGRASGEELKALGINWNLAPVLDVNNNPKNPVIGVRSFGESPEKVAAFGRASMQGMQAAGIATTLKHFPGHGDTDVDSHLDLPVIKHQMDRLEELELKPFKACMTAGADTVMTAHVYFPTLEKSANIPATISKAVITGLLREKLGYDGVVTTDCMEMNAILHGIGTEKGAVAALGAGVDFIMISHTYERQIGAIKEMIRAVETGIVSESMIDKANERINTLKNRITNWDDLSLDQPDVPEIVGSKQHARLAYDVYKKSVTIVKNEAVFPVQVEDLKRILVIHPDNGTTMQVEDKRYAHLSLGDVIRHYHANVDVHQFTTLTDEAISSIVKKAQDYDFVIVGTLSLSPGSKQINLINHLMQNIVRFAVIAMRGPYDLSYVPSVPALINTYEFTYPALMVAVGVIFGQEKASGKLPVTIK